MKLIVVQTFMKLIVVQTLDNQVLDKEIDDINQIKKFLYLLEENNLQVKDDILYFIDYGVHKISKININFIYDSKFIDIYKALKKNNYLKDYVLDYLGEYHVDIEQEQTIPQQFNNFNQRVNSKYKYGSVFKKIKKQQFLEDGNIDKLYNIDPLPKKPYFIWLVEQYKSGKLLPEDFFKAEELLEQFSNKRLRSDLKKNGYPVKIEHYDSINDLFSAINSLDDSIDHELDKKYALVQARKVAENNDWIISVPKTHEESVLISRYGGMTNWCTAADSSDGEDEFDNYTEDGESPLFICINKNNPEEKYQLNNSRSRGFSFMNANDNQVFIQENSFDVINGSLIDLLHEPEIFNELYYENSLDPMMGGIYKLQMPIIENGVCKSYFKPKTIDELNKVLSECLIFEKDFNINGINIYSLPDDLDIRGNFSLQNTQISELPKNIKIGKDLILMNTGLTKLQNIPIINGKLEINNCKELTELSGSLIVKGDLYLNNTGIIKLPDNLVVNEKLILFDNIKLTELPKNLFVGDSVLAQNTNIEKISNGTIINGSLILKNSDIKELPNNLTVGKNLDLLNSEKLKKLPDNLTVNGDLNLSYTQINKLPPNLKVGGRLELYFVPINKLPDDLEVGGALNLSNTNITELPDSLKVINGNLSLNNSNIIELPDNLDIGGNLDLSKTPIEYLPNGLIVNGMLMIENTNITKLPYDLIVTEEIFQ